MNFLNVTFTSQLVYIELQFTNDTFINPQHSVLGIKYLNVYDINYLLKRKYMNQH